MARPTDYTSESKLVDIKDLVPYARNARTHSEQQVSQIAASIKEFGFLNPIIIDGDNGIIAGHGRLLAAQKLGLQSVPVVEAKHLTDAQKKAYIIADNRLALNAGWDTDLLKIEFEELNALDFDLSLTGFEDGEIAELLKDQTEGLTDEDAVPEAPEEPVTKPGDVWVMGKHRLVCGDCTDPLSWERLCIPDGSIVFTSPPYNAGESSCLRDKHQKGEKKTRKFYDKYDDNGSADEYCELLRSFIAAAFCHADAIAVNIQMLAGNKKPLLTLLDDMADQIVDIITWDKKAGPPHIRPGILSSRFEWIVVFSKEKATRVIPYSSWQGKHSNVYTAPNASSTNQYFKEHGATFPVHLPEFVAGDLMNRSRGIIDPFCGTGTTVIAGEKLNKESFGIELSERYCDITVKRWQDFTGKQAILESTGQTFSELSNGIQEVAA